MAVSVAEYLGMRTDVELPIEPCEVPPVTRATIPLCPFNNLPCSKISKKNKNGSKHPVCAVRKNDGTFYIVCEDRLISASTVQISDYQKEMLLQTAKALFHPDIESHQIGYKSEVRIRTGENKRHRADFILAAVDEGIQTFGPRRILVEVQGGGETNNTGSISRHLEQWAQETKDNVFLRKSVGAGTIETNAWRRLQEQLFAKATTAKKTGCGFAVLLGEVVFDYVANTIPEIHTLQMAKEDRGWDMAFIVFREKHLNPDRQVSSGAVELELDTEKTIYTKLETLLAILLTRGWFSPEAFAGDYKTLSGEKMRLRDDGTIEPIPLQ
ncbi:MAG: hypothetical protein ABI947_24100 [Chloroflexota bacterium]